MNYRFSVAKRSLAGQTRSTISEFVTRPSVPEIARTLYSGVPGIGLGFGNSSRFFLFFIIFFSIVTDGTLTDPHRRPINAVSNFPYPGTREIKMRIGRIRIYLRWPPVALRYYTISCFHCTAVTVYFLFVMK